MKKLLFLLLIFCLNWVLAQGPTEKQPRLLIEELNPEFKNATSDSLRLKILIKSARKISESDPDKAILYLEEAYSISKKMGHERGLCFSCFGLGWAHWQKSNFTIAEKIYLNAIPYCKKLKDQITLAACYGNLASTYESLGKFDKAVEYDLKALKIYESNKNTLGMYNIHNNIATLYFNRGELDLALKNFKEALLLVSTLNDSLHLGTVHGNLASVYFELGQYEE